MKQNIAKCGLLSESSTLQHTLKSIPEAIAEKEKSPELADVERLEEKEEITPLKLPVHLSDGLEFFDQLLMDRD